VDVRPLWAPIRQLQHAVLRESHAIPLEAFTPVMATGIVSLVWDLHGRWAVGQILFFVNLGLFAGMGGLVLSRLVGDSRSFLDELNDGRRDPGAFALVAGTCTVGLQCVVLEHRCAAGVAVLLLLVATATLSLTLELRPRVPSGDGRPQLIDGCGRSWRLCSGCSFFTSSSPSA